MTEHRQTGDIDGRETAIPGHLRHARDPITRREIAEVVAIWLQPVGVLTAEPEPGLVDQAAREHVRVARGEAVHADRLVPLAELAAVGIAVER